MARQKETMAEVLRRAMVGEHGQPYEAALHSLHAELAGTSHALVLSGKDARIVMGAQSPAGTVAPLSFGHPGAAPLQEQLAEKVVSAKNPGTGNSPGNRP